MQVSISVDARETLRMLKQMPNFVRKEVRGRFRTLGRSFRNELRAQFPKRSGKLQRAIFSGFDRKSRRGDIAVIIAANQGKVPYAGVIDRGGNIRPKRASMLAIPLSRGRAANKYGHARFQARDLRANPQAYGYARSFVRNDIVFGVRSGGQVEALFKLEPNVIIPRRDITKSFARSKRSEVETAVKSALDLAITAADKPGATAPEA